MNKDANGERQVAASRGGAGYYRMLPRSLDGQLILFTTLSLVVAILGYAAFTASRQSEMVYKTMATQMSALAKNLAEVSASYVVTGNLIGIEEVASKSAGFPGVLSILIVDADGKPLSEIVSQGGRISTRYGKEQIRLPPVQGDHSLVDDDDDGRMLRGWHLLTASQEKSAAWQPVMGGRLVGWVRVTYGLEAMHASVVRAWRDAMLFSGLAIGVALSLLVLLLKSPMRAVKAATQFAENLDHRLGEQMPLISAPAEIEALGTALNNVSSRLQFQERALQEAAGFMQRILDSAVDGIITIDGRGIIQSFNPSASAIFGYAADEVIGQNVKILMPEPNRSAHDSYLERYRQTGIGHIIGGGREVEGCRKDGTIFAMDLAVSLSAHEGQPLFIGLARDITERKRVERMKSEFVSTVSHELRTPLTSISGALGLVTGGALGEIPGQARQMLDIAYKNSVRLAHLINDLLDMEKLVAGKMSFEMQVLPLMPLLEQGIEAIRAYGEQHRVQFKVTERCDEVQVCVDSIRFQQVLTNLLSNATKFSPPGSQVEVAAQCAGNRVRVNVIDHGPGVSQEFRARIFEKFSQADSSDTRQKGGTGLGLAISKEIIERMDGSLDFVSEEGKGACFYFELLVCEAGQ